MFTFLYHSDLLYFPSRGLICGNIITSSYFKPWVSFRLFVSLCNQLILSFCLDDPSGVDACNLCIGVCFRLLTPRHKFLLLFSPLSIEPKRHRPYLSKFTAITKESYHITHFSSLSLHKAIISICRWLLSGCFFLLFTSFYKKYENMSVVQYYVSMSVVQY